MLSLPFYQTEWSGIDLRAISAETGTIRGQLPSSAFYERYYQLLAEKGVAFSGLWLQRKARQSAFLRDQIVHYGSGASTILSIGAGTAIIEKPLLEAGFCIDLQDFQAESFKSLGVDRLAACYSCPLTEIGKTYDIAFSSAVSYALSSHDLKIFLCDIYNVLNPGGVFIWLDASLSWYDVYSYLRNRKRLKQEAVLWGYKRSLSMWRKLASPFTAIEQRYYDADMNPVIPSSFLGIPVNDMPVWQMMVLRK